MPWKTSVLVVANQTADSPELIEALGERAAASSAEFTLLLPPLADRRAEARGRIEAAVASWREAGLEASGEVGDSDPVVAVQEIWDPGRFDEVIVSTLSTGTSKWLQIDLPHRVERITGVTVRHVVATPPEPPPEPGASPRAAPSKADPTDPLGRWVGAPRDRRG